MPLSRNRSWPSFYIYRPKRESCEERWARFEICSSSARSNGGEEENGSKDSRGTNGKNERNHRKRPQKSDWSVVVNVVVVDVVVVVVDVVVVVVDVVVVRVVGFLCYCWWCWRCLHHRNGLKIKSDWLVVVNVVVVDVVATIENTLKNFTGQLLYLYLHIWLRM